MSAKLKFNTPHHTKYEMTFVKFKVQEILFQKKNGLSTTGSAVYDTNDVYDQETKQGYFISSDYRQLDFTDTI